MSLRLRNPLNILRSHSIALDAGSGRTIITDPQSEVLLDEPTFIAIEYGTGSVIATGAEAKSYLGKAPERIQVIRPIQGGVIVDYDAAKALLGSFFKRIFLADGKRLKVCAVVSNGITDLEKRTFYDCCRAAGAAKVDTVDAPLAAAVGAGLDIREPKGRLLLGIGAGLAEASVLCLTDVIHSETARLGADVFHEAVSQHLASRYKVSIGENMAEQVAQQLAWANRPDRSRSMTLTGKYSGSGTPCALDLTDDDLEGAIDGPLDQLEALVRKTMDKTPAELVADIADTGLVLYGGGAQIHGLDTWLSARLGLRTRLAKDPFLVSVLGAASTLRPDLDFKKLLVK